MKTAKTKCDFCKYKSNSGCMVTPNSFYCREASDEYSYYIKNKSATSAQKSFRPWDRNNK